MVRARTRLEEADEDSTLREILDLVPAAQDEVTRRQANVLCIVCLLHVHFMSVQSLLSV